MPIEARRETYESKLLMELLCNGLASNVETSYDAFVRFNNTRKFLWNELVEFMAWMAWMDGY